MRLTKKVRSRLQEKAKALYVQMPRTIKREEDVAALFTGNFKVNLMRQSSRHCYVIFNDVEEKMKNLKASQGKLIDGKRVLVSPANTTFKKSKVPKKKLVVPKVKPDIKVTKTLFVSNIKCGIKVQELKEAFVGCASVKLLKPYTPESRAAIIRMESVQIAAEYLSQAREPPIIGGRKLRVNPDTRIKHKRRQSAGTLKVYDGKPEEEPKPDKKSKKRKGNSMDHVEV